MHWLLIRELRSVYEWPSGSSVLDIHSCQISSHYYLLCTRKSSWAWDCILEILTLAYNNSRPTPQALQNMSAGIKCIQTFRKVAIIRATNPVKPDIEVEDGSVSQLHLSSTKRTRLLGTTPFCGRIEVQSQHLRRPLGRLVLLERLRIL